MSKIKNVNAGLDQIAKIFLDKNSDKNLKPIVYATAGPINSIKLHIYKMSDGSEAKEYLQMIMENDDGQNVHFLGLATKKKNFIWPTDKMLRRVKEKTLI